MIKFVETAPCRQLTLLMCLALLVGCGTPIPDIVPVKGSISIDGKPLPKAEVRFVPMVEGLDGNYIASAITDNNGEFALRLQGKEEVGCVGCLCKVTIDDQPLPDEVRAAYGSGNQRLVKRYEGSLKNRPIPSEYNLLRTTPLEYQISADQLQIDIEISR